MKAPAIPLTPRGLPEPGQQIFPTRTLDRWNKFLGVLASGAKIEDAMLQCSITRADIEGVTRGDPLEYQKWLDARKAAKRSVWNAIMIEDVMDRIAAGMFLKDAVREVAGHQDQAANFMAIVHGHPELLAQLKAAKAAGALMMEDELVRIADDDSNDVIESDRETKSGAIMTTRLPNTAAVQRSKLRVDTKRWQMGSWNEIFAERRQKTEVNVQVNYAERLEEARERAKHRGRLPTQEPVMEAEFVPVLPEDDTKWMDEAPTDPMWREEK